VKSLADLLGLDNVQGLDAPGSLGDYEQADAELTVTDLCRKILGSAEYLSSIETRVRVGTLPPTVEAMLWHYAYGKPAENVNLNVQKEEEDLSTLSTEELLKRAEVLHAAISEARAAEEVIEATTVTKH
jgi:hypothetical protein